MAAKKKKKPKYNQNASIRGALRRQFARSPQIKEVKKTARKEFPNFKKDGALAKRPKIRYLCACCGSWFKGTDIAVDHISPVIDERGFVNWDVFIERLHCDSNNLQVLCSYKLKDVSKHGNEVSCHLKKTREERKK